jgi:hypothetical protein
MATPDILAVVGAVCALLMVVGSLVLLYRGTITLQQANPEEAIKVQFQNVLNIQTRYPAIALFVVGIIFLTVAYWFEMNMGVANTLLKGTLVSNDPGDAVAEFMSHLGESRIDSEKGFQKMVPSNLEEIEVTVRETGYEPVSTAVRPKQAKNGMVPFTAKLTKKVEKPRKDSSQIADAPAGLPSMQRSSQ